MVAYMHLYGKSLVRNSHEVMDRGRGAHLEQLINGQDPMLALFGDTNAVSSSHLLDGFAADQPES